MNYCFDEVIDRTHTFARKWSKDVLLKEFNTDDVIPMWIADMDFACPPPVVNALRKVADQRIYGYTYVPDVYYQAIIDWNKRRHHWTVKKDWITLTHGTVSTLHYIVQAFCQPGDKVLVQTPGYQPFQRAAEHHQCQLVTNPLVLKDGKYYLDFDDLEAKAKDPAVKLLIFCNPHNPAGRVWSKEELIKAARICRDHDVLMVSDEIHKDISLYGHKPISLASISQEIAENCIVCVSPNKAFNFGGLKSSYTVIANDDIRLRLQEQLQINSITSPNVFAVPALVAAYTKCDDWLDQLNAYIENNFDTIRKFLADHLPKIQLIEPEATYLAWLDVRKFEITNHELQERLINQGKVALEDGNDFIADGEGFIRMNLGCPKSVVEEALRRMAKCLKTL
ncbi:MalY/PatB family protein [Scopulibacillus cellulosilyticus]|uniref:cysteine-S-conjugate beta-lyase n=1 Tax=Scopulibacillus cellulosilyticus TaxID=2665665 RepID=A0ABW2Q4D2_9BACL